MELVEERTVCHNSNMHDPFVMNLLVALCITFGSVDSEINISQFLITSNTTG